ncbi:uncharacterized protein EAF01_002782 [Botrytis porri]|uniref:uncharacterized protein n=1 Tax=Botrytis porri TaxID=87229 RepID=UPI001901D7C2|nr:uncharacterized protein EAF01_002782 [Botrytis porri]KAF7911275.1 hypothetical protein EAF01_002782 [Botrytis porri]
MHCLSKSPGNLNGLETHLLKQHFSHQNSPHSSLQPQTKAITPPFAKLPRLKKPPNSTPPQTPSHLLRPTTAAIPPIRTITTYLVSNLLKNDAIRQSITPSQISCLTIPATIPALTPLNDDPTVKIVAPGPINLTNFHDELATSFAYRRERKLRDGSKLEQDS